MSEETKKNEDIQETQEEKIEEVKAETPESTEVAETAENAETAAPADVADEIVAESTTGEADKSKERTESETRTRTPDTRRRDDSQNRGQRGDSRGQSQRFSRFRKKVCRFCENPEVKIDYKNPDQLERFITERGKILPRRITGTCARHQRLLATAIKQSRTIALLPFVVK